MTSTAKTTRRIPTIAVLIPSGTTPKAALETEELVKAFKRKTINLSLILIRKSPNIIKHTLKPSIKTPTDENINDKRRKKARFKYPQLI